MVVGAIQMRHVCLFERSPWLKGDNLWATRPMPLVIRLLIDKLEPTECEGKWFVEECRAAYLSRPLILTYYCLIRRHSAKANLGECT